MYRQLCIRSHNDEWPIIGPLSVPFVGSGIAWSLHVAPLRCAPVTTLYNDLLRHFDQAINHHGIASVKFAGFVDPPSTDATTTHHNHPTEARLSALLVAVTFPNPLTLNSDAMSILPRFSHTSGADLESNRVPPPVIALREQTRSTLHLLHSLRLSHRSDSKNQSHDNRLNSPATRYQD